MAQMPPLLYPEWGKKVLPIVLPLIATLINLYPSTCSPHPVLIACCPQPRSQHQKKKTANVVRGCEKYIFNVYLFEKIHVYYSSGVSIC